MRSNSLPKSVVGLSSSLLSLMISAAAVSICIWSDPLIFDCGGQKSSHLRATRSLVPRSAVHLLGSARLQPRGAVRRLVSGRAIWASHAHTHTPHLFQYVRRQSAMLSGRQGGLRHPRRLAVVSACGVFPVLLRVSPERCTRVAAILWRWARSRLSLPRPSGSAEGDDARKLAQLCVLWKKKYTLLCGDPKSAYGLTYGRIAVAVARARITLLFSLLFFHTATYPRYVSSGYVQRS